MKKILIFLLASMITTLADAQEIRIYKNGATAPIATYTNNDSTIYTIQVRENLDYVDLGLPSGTLWATCNVGASKPEEYGDYFAWGETEPYYTSLNPLTWKDGKSDGYCWESYKHCNGSKTTMTKYCTSSDYGTVDNKTILEPEDDAATANWGFNWRMPTVDEYDELINSSYTTSTWTTMGGVNGYLIASKSNDSSIFLPASGYRSSTGNYEVGSLGIYSSSTLSSNYSFSKRKLFFSSEEFDTDDATEYRCDGYSIRPVLNK